MRMLMSTLSLLTILATVTVCPALALAAPEPSVYVNDQGDRQVERGNLREIVNAQERLAVPASEKQSVGDLERTPKAAEEPSSQASSQTEPAETAGAAEVSAEEADKELPRADSEPGHTEERAAQSAQKRQAGRSRKRGYGGRIIQSEYYKTSSSYSRPSSFSTPLYTPTTYSKSDFGPSTTTYFPTMYSTSSSFYSPLSSKSEDISEFSYGPTYRPSVTYYSSPLTTYYSRPMEYAPYSKDADDFAKREYYNYYRPRATYYRPTTRYYSAEPLATTYSKDSDFDSYSFDADPTKGYRSRVSSRPTTWTTYDYEPSPSYSFAASKDSDIFGYTTTYYPGTYYSRSAYYTPLARPATYRTAYTRPAATYTYPTITRTTRLLRDRSVPLKVNSSQTATPTFEGPADPEAMSLPEKEEESTSSDTSPEKSPDSEVNTDDVSSELSTHAEGEEVTQRLSSPIEDAQSRAEVDSAPA
ncbi:hypothetical protein BESB_006870 [Besnoitia besnoiti]|uniref:Toxoplasma gondii family A protein n=1 Tax=Besnoitia besnoiti TaxID=94643 RepID=A0A2A9MPQ3_BESBE|nr:hypothetical protein BESB_006870 [Besnoitia besnoiti]PFH38346.1 hypothetical protein BESB_006870 [Besnoitia besnoiti]